MALSAYYIIWNVTGGALVCKMIDKWMGKDVHICKFHLINIASSEVSFYFFRFFFFCNMLVNAEDKSFQ